LRCRLRVNGHCYGSRSDLDGCRESERELKVRTRLRHADTHRQGSEDGGE